MAVLGTNTVDKIVGSAAKDVIFAEGGNDVVSAGAGNDYVFGGGGNDILLGEGGDDAIFGATTSGGVVDLNKLRITEDVSAKVTFVGETASYQNALGVYKIAADGSVSGVEIIFANASLASSGGNLKAGVSNAMLDLKAGEQLGFFIVPNGYAQKNMAKLLADEKGSFKFVNKDGTAGNVNNGGEMYLVHVSSKGTETMINSEYGKSVFHSISGADDGLNGDHFVHATATVDVASGTLTVGMEDLWGGGDKDFDDSVFKIDIGVTNAALLGHVPSGSGSSPDQDTIIGGEGNDKLFGMADDDVVEGGAGNDSIWGNSGNDHLSGGAGNDVVRGGSGDDHVAGDAGNDDLYGNSGDDMMFGGDGNDTIAGGSGNDTISDGAGNDQVDAGSGDDTVIAGEGNDVYNGKSGFDTLDFSAAASGMTIDLSKHSAVGMGIDEINGFEKVVGSGYDDVIKGDKRDNVLVGGDGNDTLRSLGGADVLTGGAGNDKFVFATKDVVDPVTGEHLGTDLITDLGKGDMIDLHDMLKGQKYGSLDDVVKISDADAGATIAVKIGEAFVDVVTVAGWTADDLHASGMILA